MGNDQSVKRQTHEMMYDSFMYAPVVSYRTQAEHQSNFKLDEPKNGSSSKSNSPLLSTAYRGVWSMTYSSSLAPPARTGQCHVYDPETNSLVIAYGSDRQGRYLNDMWSLNLDQMKWRKVNKSLLAPRQYSSAVLIGREMYIFGGAHDNVFYNDLHRVNIDNGKCEQLTCTGTQPVPRTSPMIFAVGNVIYIAGGFNGRAHGGVYYVNINDLEWHRFNSSNTGLPAPSYCMYKNKYFVFGGVNGASLAQFFPEKGEFTPFPCIGTEPTIDLTRCSLVEADEYIFLIGGESTAAYMHIFALDVKRQWWFAFHVRPDNNSLSISDGTVNKTGLFMLPREHSAAVVYSTKLRSIVSVMGSRMTEPPPIFTIEIGEALGFLHLRNDMLDMLLLTQER